LSGRVIFAAAKLQIWPDGARDDVKER